METVLVAPPFIATILLNLDAWVGVWSTHKGKNERTCSLCFTTSWGFQSKPPAKFATVPKFLPLVLALSAGVGTGTAKMIPDAKWTNGDC